MVSGTYPSTQALHAETLTPVDVMQAVMASISDWHGSADGAGVAGTETGAGVVVVVGVGGGATGLEGDDGDVGGYGQPRKHSSQLHASYASMNDPQLAPQLLVQASIWLQMDVVNSPHVVSLVRRSKYEL